jgi:uncharacterized protein (DUF362 family)
MSRAYRISRRKWVPLAGLGLASSAVGLLLRPGNAPAATSNATILKADSYQKDLAGILGRGMEQCYLQVKGKRVLLKPNLVEYDARVPINTNPVLVNAAYEAFRRLGAAEVRIAEGPGHRRDTQALLEQAGYREIIPDLERRFVDLNRDDVAAVRGFAGKPEFYFPVSVLDADVIVSLAKMKTHHWAGVTLSMKNLFGLVPGSVYGWPKNPLHFIGIEKSILALRRAFPNTFSIVDGIEGMEGNGPIQGTGVASGVIVMGGDPVAVDATCCRVMGVDPERVGYLAESGGVLKAEHIEQRGETPQSVRRNYALVSRFSHLRLA